MGKVIIILCILSFASCMAASAMYIIRSLRRPDEDSTYGEPDPTQGRGSDVFGGRG